MPLWFWAFVYKQLILCIICYFRFSLLLILLVCCLLGAKNYFGLWYPSTFMGCILIYQKLVDFVSFMGPMNTSPTSLSVMDNDQFLLLFICGAVSFITLAVLRVCSLHRLYSLVHLWSYLVIFCKAIDLIALFIYGFLEPITFCWAVSLIALPNPGLQEPVTFVRLSAL